MKLNIKKISIVVTAILLAVTPFITICGQACTVTYGETELPEALKE